MNACRLARARTFGELRRDECGEARDESAIGDCQRRGAGLALTAMRNRPMTIALAVLVWWGLNALVWAGQVMTMRAAIGQPATWGDVLRLELASAALWVPATLWLLWCVQRYPFQRGRVLRALTWLLFAVAVVLVFRAAAVIALNAWIGWYAQLPSLPQILLTSALNNLVMCWLIVGVAHALVYAEYVQRRERQTIELEARLSRARLDALSAQLNPHFLFNALNSIAEMVHRDADAADRMLVDLGALLRHSLDASKQQQIPLREELAALDHYVGIEKVRLGERLRMVREIDLSLLDTRVPHLVLQPLVENAILHAVAQRTTPGEVTVRAIRDQSQLLLEVEDDGGDCGAHSGSGIGLDNTRARLQFLYGDDQRIEVDARAGGGTRVRLWLPYWDAEPT